MTSKKVSITVVLLILAAISTLYFWSRSTDVTTIATPSRTLDVPVPQLVKLMEEGEGKPSKAVKGGAFRTPALTGAPEVGRPTPPASAQVSKNATPDNSGSESVKRPVTAPLPQPVESKPQTPATVPVTQAKAEKPAMAAKGETRGAAALPDGQGYGRTALAPSAQVSRDATPETWGSQLVRRPIIAPLPQPVESKPQTPATVPVTPAKAEKPAMPSTEIRDPQGERPPVSSKGEDQPQGPAKAPALPDSRARRTYQVRAGDCLANIASSREIYGDFSMWKALYLANPEVIDYVYYRKTLPYVILEAGLELQVPELSEARRLMDVIPKSKPVIIKLAESPKLTEMLRLAVSLKRVGHQVYIQELPSATGAQYLVKLGFFQSKREARNVLQSLPMELHRDLCAVLPASEKEIREHFPFSRRVTD